MSWSNPTLNDKELNQASQIPAAQNTESLEHTTPILEKATNLSLNLDLLDDASPSEAAPQQGDSGLLTGQNDSPLFLNTSNSNDHLEQINAA